MVLAWKEPDRVEVLDFLVNSNWLHTPSHFPIAR
jgi:hypothetical protein